MIFIVPFMDRLVPSSLYGSSGSDMDKPYYPIRTLCIDICVNGSQAVCGYTEPTGPLPKIMGFNETLFR
jgi:hypothetical protein